MYICIVQYIATCYFDFKGTNQPELAGKGWFKSSPTTIFFKEALARVIAMVYFVGSLKPLGF